MFNSKDTKKPTDFSLPPRPAPTTGRAPAEGTITAYLGPDTHIEGTLRFQHSVLIEGTFKGEIQSAGNLVIGESATVEARISTRTISVKGVVKGTIEATERVQIQGSGQVYGDITTASLQMDESVVFHGSCSMPTNNGGKASTPYTNDRNEGIQREQDRILDAVMKSNDD